MAKLCSLTKFHAEGKIDPAVAAILESITADVKTCQSTSKQLIAKTKEIEEQEAVRRENVDAETDIQMDIDLQMGEIAQYLVPLMQESQVAIEAVVAPAPDEDKDKAKIKATTEMKTRRQAPTSRTYSPNPERKTTSWH